MRVKDDTSGKLKKQKRPMALRIKDEVQRIKDEQKQSETLLNRKNPRGNKEASNSTITQQSARRGGEGLIGDTHKKERMQQRSKEEHGRSKRTGERERERDRVSQEKQS